MAVSVCRTCFWLLSPRRRASCGRNLLLAITFLVMWIFIFEYLTLSSQLDSSQLDSSRLDSSRKEGAGTVADHPPIENRIDGCDWCVSLCPVLFVRTMLTLDTPSFHVFLSPLSFFNRGASSRGLPASSPFRRVNYLIVYCRYRGKEREYPSPEEAFSLRRRSSALRRDAASARDVREDPMEPLLEWIQWRHSVLFPYADLDSAHPLSVCG